MGADGPVLVVGATGTIGRTVVAELMARGVAVRAFTRDPSRAAAVLQSDGGGRSGAVEIVKGDLNDRTSVRQAARGCSQLFITTADSPGQVEWEVDTVRTVLDAGADHIVKISSCDATADATYLWARHHYRIEQALRELTPRHSILRPHFFMQNLFSFSADVIGRGILSAPAGTGRLGMIDARDIGLAAAVLLAAGKPLGRSAELTGPSPVSFADVTDAIGAALGRAVRYEDVAPERHRQRMLQEEGTTPEQAEDVLGVYADIRNGVLDRHTGEVQSITGRSPRPITRFASDYADRFC